MATPTWKSYAVRPSGIGGAASLCSWVVAGSDAAADAILEVCALVSDKAVSWGDTSAKRADFDVDRNAISFDYGFPAGPAVASFFARTAAGWIAGPSVSVDISPTAKIDFAYPKNWVIDVLQRIERDFKPWGETRLEIRGSFPRDNIPLPCISVQFEASPQGQKVLGNIARDITLTSALLRIPWNVNLTMQVWCETPEDRDKLAPWFHSALDLLADMAPHQGFDEPVHQFNENEDYSMAFYEKPIFLLVGTLSGICWSSLTLPDRNWIGHLTV